MLICIKRTFKWEPYLYDFRSTEFFFFSLQDEINWSLPKDIPSPKGEEIGTIQYCPSHQLNTPLALPALCSQVFLYKSWQLQRGNAKVLMFVSLCQSVNISHMYFDRQEEERNSPGECCRWLASAWNWWHWSQLLGLAVQPIFSSPHCLCIQPVLHQFVFAGVTGDSVQNMLKDKINYIHSSPHTPCQSPDCRRLSGLPGIISSS